MSRGKKSGREGGGGGGAGRGCRRSSGAKQTAKKGRVFLGRFTGSSSRDGWETRDVLTRETKAADLHCCSGVALASAGESQEICA